MKPGFELEGRGLRLRAWRNADLPALVRHANNRKIWLNLTDRFPHPYTPEAGRGWLALQGHEDHHELVFAIDVDGEAVGAIGLNPQADLNVRVAEIGYWLGEPFWGRGLCTEAVCLVTAHAFEETEFVRLTAHVLDWNPASARVLEKAGYTLEARQPRNILKDGQIIDSLLYVKLR
jgi:RimJ/RimL family protein N-acetyltransferase